ncbi:MAG: hypothetical protein F2867_07750, partial [Actinobacteria bacterium]|nr:hypothetical protein [Actinomycetota bacterium]
MASTKKTDRKFGPDRPDAPGLVRRQRMWSVWGTWLFILVFFVAPIVFGNAYFVVPAVGFTVALVATMRLSRRPDGPDAETLAKGELHAATPEHPVSVNAVWSPGVRVRGEPPRPGFLLCDGKRLRFECLDDQLRFDASIDRIEVITVPSFMRPQLDLS